MSSGAFLEAAAAATARQRRREEGREEFGVEEKGAGLAAAQRGRRRPREEGEAEEDEEEVGVEEKVGGDVKPLSDAVVIGNAAAAAALVGARAELLNAPRRGAVDLADT